MTNLAPEGTMETPLPFTARPRLFGDLFFVQLIPLFFLAIGVCSGWGRPFWSGEIILDGIPLLCIIGWNAGLLSRQLAITGDGISYRTFFISCFFPYTSIRSLEIFRQVTNSGRGGAYITYLLTITAVKRQLKLRMDYYRLADLIAIARAINTNAPKVRLNNLSKHLIKGDMDFSR